MTPPIPEDYGGFAPRFYGVTTRLHSKHDFDLLDCYIRDPEHGADDKSIKAISLKSVLDHEARHFHDFLINPYGSFAFRCKIQAARNGIGLLRLLDKRPGEWLPAPIVVWCTMGDERRNEYIQEWRESLGSDITIVDIPNITRIDFRSIGSSADISLEKSDPDSSIAVLMETIRLSYNRLQELTQGMVAEPSSPELTPYNFMEVLALSTQLQSIWHAQSADCSTIFRKMLENSEVSYAKLWRRVWSLVEVLPAPRAAALGSPSIIDQIVAIVQWCMLGNFMIDNIRACPNVRFLLLEAFLRSNASDEDNAYDVEAVWRRWDTELDLPPWRQGVEHAVLSNCAFGAKLLELREGGITEAIAEVFAVFCRDQKKAVQVFLEDPNLLVKQERYINYGADAGLPLPIIRLEFSGFQMRCSPGGPWAPMWEDKPGSEVSQVVLRRDRSIDDFLAYSVNVERAILMADLIMADQEPPRGLNRFAHADIKLFSGKKLLWIV